MSPGAPPTREKDASRLRPRGRLASNNFKPEKCAPVYLPKAPQIANGAVEPAGSAARRCGWGAALGLVLLLGACESAGTGGQSPARPASPTTYPDLASVPSRPVFRDTLAQRGELGRQLAADREAALRRAAELDYAAGRGAAPPPASTAAPAPAAPASPPAGPPAGDSSVARAYVANSFNDVRDRGKLRQFMLRLGREAPDPFGPSSLAQALGLESPPEQPPAPDPAAAR